MGKRTYLRTEDGGQRSEVRRRRAKVGVSASYSRRCRLHLLSSIFHHQSAFTLVELLVVIVIIGVLAALLLPVLTAAKERAIRVACLHNVKQLDLAAIMYARDNNDRLPDSFPTTGMGLGGGPLRLSGEMMRYVQRMGFKPETLFDPGYKSAYRDTIIRANWDNRPASWDFACIGYVETYPLAPAWATKLPDMNWTIAPQPVQVGSVMLPPPNQSQRVLTAGAIMWRWDGSQMTYWNGIFVTLPPTNGVYELPNHRISRGTSPAGENVAMMDGSANWRNFRDMKTHIVADSGLGALSGPTPPALIWW